MVTALLRLIGAIIQLLSRSAVLELLGFVAVVVAIAALAGPWWGVLAVGIGLLLKSAELDVTSRRGDAE